MIKIPEYSEIYAEYCAPHCYTETCLVTKGCEPIRKYDSYTILG